MSRAAALRRIGSAVVVSAVALLALVQCQGFAAEEAVVDGGGPDATTGDEVVVPEASIPDAGSCLRTPYAVGQVIDRGSVCGVGACRTHLTGDDCPKVSLDGAPASVCAQAFPAETCATPTDDNCDGVLNEGCQGASATAGMQCVGCAESRAVKRGAQPACDPLAASVNQGGKRFGTYTSDYQCMQMGANQMKTIVPNTGDCNFVPKNNGFGPVADNRFGYQCCCKL